jgi:hypothetical protein
MNRIGLLFVVAFTWKFKNFILNKEAASIPSNNNPFNAGQKKTTFMPEKVFFYYNLTNYFIY